MPCCEERLTIRPRASARGSCVSICCTARLQPKNTPVRLTAMTRFHCSSVVSTSEVEVQVAALLTMMSSRPNRATASPTSLSIAPQLETSHAWK